MLRAMEESIDAPKHRRNASTMSESSSSFDFNPITPGSSKLILQHILIYLMEMLILSLFIQHHSPSGLVDGALTRNCSYNHFTR